MQKQNMKFDMHIELQIFNKYVAEIKNITKISLKVFKIDYNN